MKVFVTGATGMVGFNTVKALIERGDVVHALIRSNSPNVPELKRLGARIFKGDLRDIDSLRNAAKGVDAIINTASLVTDWAPKKDFEEIIVKGADNICGAADEAAVKRLVHISTNDVFGFKGRKMIDESFPYQPCKELYPIHKAKADKIVFSWHNNRNLPISIIYPVCIIGERDRTVLPEIADAICKKEMIFWEKSTLLWTSNVLNVVDIALEVIDNDKAIGQGYIVHDGDHTTIEELCTRIAKAFEVPFAPRYIPPGLAYCLAIISQFRARMTFRKSRPFLTTYLVKALSAKVRYSIEKANRDLGWRPVIGRDESIESGVEWLLKLGPDSFKQK